MSYPIFTHVPNLLRRLGSTSDVQYQAMTNNVANMNTDGFSASDVTFTSGPGGEGLNAHVSPTKAPAPVILRDGQLRLGSNTDLTRETVTRATAAAAFKANLGVMASQDSFAGRRFDHRVGFVTGAATSWVTTPAATKGVEVAFEEGSRNVRPTRAVRHAVQLDPLG